MQDDNQLKYLIQLCRDKNIPEEEILKILEENSKSEFIVNLEKSWKSSDEYSRVPQKWQEFSVKYIEYIGSLMDPTKCYSTLPLEPNWPNPQVKKKTEGKLKRELVLYVLQEKNKCLKKYLKVSDPTDLFSVVTAVNSAYNTPNTVKQELESWNFREEEFTSKNAVLVDLDVKKRDLEKSMRDQGPTKKMKMSESEISKLDTTEIEVEPRNEEKVGNLQDEKEEDEDLKSLREKVLMSRKNAKKQEDEQAAEQVLGESQSVKGENDNNDDISLEEGEISSDQAEEEVKEVEPEDTEENDAKPFDNNHGKRFVDSKIRRYDNRYRKDDRRDRNTNQTSGTVEKHRAVVHANSAIAPYMTYPAGGNFNQSNNYMGAMHMFRPPIFAMGYNQQYLPPNPYMQIDSNAVAKAQMLASMSQQQSQPIFSQMSGTRSGGPAMNRPPMQYTNSNQSNFWMMNMPHMNNGTGFAFAPGNVPQNSFYPFAPRPSDSSHMDTNYMYENPNSRP